MPSRSLLAREMCVVIFVVLRFRENRKFRIPSQRRTHNYVPFECSFRTEVWLGTTQTQFTCKHKSTSCLFLFQGERKRRIRLVSLYCEYLWHAWTSDSLSCVLNVSVCHERVFMSTSIKAISFLQENKNRKSQEGNEFNVKLCVSWRRK